MIRINGWGDDTTHMSLSPKAEAMLADLVGKGRPRKDCPIEEMFARVPASRLPDHPLISVDPKDRFIHAHGQSLPDWIGMRTGTIARFPDGVAFPTSEAEVGEILGYASKHDVVVIPYGGGTSVVGHLTVPEDPRPVLSVSMKKMNRMISLDRETRLAEFEAGISGPEIEACLSPDGFTLGHFPQSFEYSTLGGWIVTRSSGQQSLHYGRIEQLFAGGVVMTEKGSLSIPPIPASAAGPSLKEVILGSEGRLGILTRATVRVSEIKEADGFYGVFFPDWDRARAAARSLAGSAVSLSMIRLSNAVETMTNLTLAGHEKAIGLLKTYLEVRGISEASMCMALIGLTGSHRQVQASKKEIKETLKKFKGIWVGKSMGNGWKKNRFLAPYLRNTLWDKGYAIDTVETAVTWDKVTQMVNSLEGAVRDTLASMGEKVHVFTHLSHVYTSGSSVYTTYIFKIGETPEATLEQWQQVKRALNDAIVAVGGTISHQHGVGLDHRDHLEAEKGPLGIDVLETVCRHVDPENRLNPGKLLPSR
ncbi:MAG: FAD-binding oxidoreductase [Myxococcota bacterium]|nr:FAD-binding oxidoreductase [Myxococcota bacterium]